MKKIRNMVNAVKTNMVCVALKTGVALANNRGEGYIDTAIKILIAVVLGALLLGGLYMLFEESLLPELQKRIMEMFDYAG